jgi:hypothetical protein
MAKTPNSSASEGVRITVSWQSFQLLEDLAAKGIWGRNAAEVAARFVDRALQEFVDQPKLVIKPDPPSEEE